MAPKIQKKAQREKSKGQEDTDPQTWLITQSWDLKVWKQTTNRFANAFHIENLSTRQKTGGGMSVLMTSSSGQEELRSLKDYCRSRTNKERNMHISELLANFQLDNLDDQNIIARNQLFNIWIFGHMK